MESGHINKILKEEIYKYVISENTSNEMMAYHGTSENFDKFDTRFIGSGEGTQAFGWGVYVTEDENTGKFYAMVNNSKRESLTADIQDRSMKIATSIINSICPQALKLGWITIGKHYGSNKTCDVDFQPDTFCSYLVAKYHLEHLSQYEMQKIALQKFNDLFTLFKNNQNKIKIYQFDEVTQDQMNKDFDFFNDNDNSTESFSDKMDKVCDIIKHVSEYYALVGYGRKKPTRIVYTVDIPDDNGSNYLEWDGIINDSLINMFIQIAKKKSYTEISRHGGNDKTHAFIVAQRPWGGCLDLNLDITNGQFYKKMVHYLEIDPFQVSYMLNKMGYTGFKVPVGRIHHKGNMNKMNYIIFNPDNVKIIKKTSF